MVRLTDLIRGAGGQPDDEGGGGKPAEKPGPAADPPVQPIQLRNLPGAGREGDESGGGPTDWYAAAVAALQGLAAAVRQRRAFTLGDLPAVATAFVTSLARDDRLFIMAVSGRTQPDQILNMVHSAIFAVKVGMGMGYRREELSRLALAALVHDLGMFRLPDEILHDPGRWSEDKIAAMRQHPTYGSELLKQAAPEHAWLPEIVWQEHERADGTGYPQGLKGYQTHEFAQVIGIADVFDALLTPRPYRKRLLPHEAVKEVLVAEKAGFPSQVIKGLVQQFSVFPLGTTVRLNTGEVGVVAQLNLRFPLRPIVRVEQQSERTSPMESKIIDLSKTTLVHIVEVVAPETGRGS